MSIINDVMGGLSKLKKEEKMVIVFKLLVDESISYTEISKLYTAYLEGKNKEDDDKKRTLAGCLATKYQGSEEYNDARSSILLYPYVPDEFIEKYFKHVSKEAIKKEKTFLKKKGWSE